MLLAALMLHDLFLFHGLSLLNCTGQACASRAFTFYLLRVEPVPTREAEVPTRPTGQTGQTAAYLPDLAQAGQTARLV